MPGLSHKGAHHIHTHSSSTSTSSCGGSAPNAKDAIWSRSRDHVTYAQLYKFWSELPYSSRQELLRIDKQTLFEQVRKNLYCSRCNGLLLEVFSQIVLYGKNIHQEATYAHALCGQPQNRNHIENGSKLIAASAQDDTSDPSVHPWGGLATTRDGVLTLLDCFLIGTSLETLQNAFDSARARERERELLYPDACGGGGRGWISQGTSTSGRGHGMKETCALHTARLSCEALVDFWSALGEETRLSLLRMKEEDFIERLMFRFDSKRFCRDCRRNVLREFKELKELKRTRREPRCTTWFCVADTAFQYEVSDCTVQADWHECFAEAGGVYHHFEWAVGTGEGKSDILGFEDVGLCGSVKADGLELDNITACFITLRAWKHDGRCTELSVKAHALEGRLCVHRRLIVGDGFVTITKGESIRRFFEHAEETEEEEDEDSTDKDGNDLETEGLRPQKHAKSPELARDFLLDAATVIFKEQVEKAFREGTARQNAHSIFVCLALGLLEERVHVACKEIITLEKQKKLLEEEAAEKREEEERKERKRLKEREKKLRRKEKLKGKEREKEKNSEPIVLISQKSANGTVPSEQEPTCHSGVEDACDTNDDTIMARSSSPDMIEATSSMHYIIGENGDGKECDMSFSVVDVDGELNARDASGSFILEQSKSARRKSKIRKSLILESDSGRLYRRGPNTSIETNGYIRSSERSLSHGYIETTTGSIHSFQKHSKSMKPDISGKADNRNSTAKCNEKYHWPNGRSHYRYEYQFCGCNSQSSDKSVRDIRIVDRYDTSFDTPKPFYRIGNHIAGAILDQGVLKGKHSAGVVSGSRGDIVSQKKVWEPLELRRQANRSPSQSSVSSNSITSKATACEKGDTIKRKIIQCTSKPNSVHHNSNNNNNNNNSNLSIMSSSTNGWSPSGSLISNGSERTSSISNSYLSESDAISEVHVQEINNAHEQTTKSSFSVPLFTGSHIDSASCISASADCCGQRRDDNGCMTMPSSHNISEKVKDIPVAGVSSCASENDCQYGGGKISNKHGTFLHVPCSNPGSIEGVERHRSMLQLGAVSSPVLNHMDDSLQTTGVSTSQVNGSVISATKGSFPTLEMAPQQQTHPVQLPSISSSMFPLHSQHNRNHNYYQSSGGWSPVSGSGLLPVTQPNCLVFPGPGGFGLSSGGLPGFSLRYPSFQPLPPVLAASQIPSSHGPTSVNYNGLTNPSRLGESQIGEVRFCTGVNLPHQETKHPPQKEGSNGLSSSEGPFPNQDGISGNSPSHDTSAFSLFHFGGPAAVTKESDLNSNPLKEESMGDCSTMKDACLAPLHQNDISMHKEQVPIEEYSLFAASCGNSPKDSIHGCKWSKISCLGKCHKIKLSMGDYLLEGHMYAIYIGGENILLGVQWLSTLGIVEMNFRDSEGRTSELCGMKFKAPQLKKQARGAAIAMDSRAKTLPASVVYDLLSIGVCPRCIFRTFSVNGDVCSFYLPSNTSLYSLLKPLITPTELPKFEDDIGSMEVKDVCASTREKQDRNETCIVCLGILQMTFLDQKKETTTCQENVAVLISEKVQYEGYQFDSFCLEVSIPPVALIRDRALWLYIKQNYGSENWFKNISAMDRLSVKEALKLSLIKPLEDLLGKNSGVNSPFRVALIYKHTGVLQELEVDDLRENSGKRRKTGENNSFHNAAVAAIHTAREVVNGGESSAAVQRALNSTSDDDFAKKYKFPPTKLCEPCKCEVVCSRLSMYIGGRYLKYSRNVSQTCWMIDDERMGENSVEEIIANAILPQLRGDSYKFHAAGREDIDVRMLGTGRPFLIEVLNAHAIPTKSDMMELEIKINDSKDSFVKVRELKEVGSDVWNLMREGEAEKQKQYAAVVWISRPLSDEDFKCISEIKEMEIEQKTPIRVLHRRSPLVRKRLIHWMKAEKIEGSSQYFLLHLCTQAGTYIKEFVHGDLGRTHP
ncbi:hypothetical protein KI387_015965, partial [Taxus chinensis]